MKRLPEPLLEPPPSYWDDEFNLVSEKEGIWQNNRLSSVFRYSDGTYSYNDDVLYRERYYVGEDAVVVEKDRGSFTGGTFVLYPDGHLRCFLGARIRDIRKFKPESIAVDCYAVEYPTDWWIFLCSEDSFNRINEKYFFQEESPERIAKEFEFNGGIYRMEMLKRVGVVGKHMYGDSFPEIPFLCVSAPKEIKEKPDHEV